MGLQIQHEARTAAEDNIGLVYSIAIELRHLPLPREDLVSEGCMGLMKAADKYNPSRGTKFSSYAATWIKQSMYRAAEKYGSEIRIPSWTLSRIRHARKIKEKPETDNTMPRKDIEKFLRLGEESRTISIHDTGIEKESLNDNEENLPYFEISMRERSHLIKESLEQLTEREKTIIVMYFGLAAGKAQTHQQISRRLGISRERVRQLQHEAVRKMKTHLKNCKELLTD